MENISEDKVEFLEDQVSNFFDLLNRSNNWVHKNLKYEEKNNLSYEIKDKRRIVRKIKNSIKSKPVFALYGASQVGKSYLIKNLLSDEGSSLKISANNKDYDFLKDINPPGVGAESTGVVTRFTIDKPSPFEKYPIKINLLGVKDIIIILCDSYFSDLKKISSYPETEDFNALITDFENKFNSNENPQTFLIEDDLLDLKEYFNKNFNTFSFIVERINECQYWNKISSIIENIPSNYWKDVFSILWGGNKHLTDLFSLLISQLEYISFEKVAYAPFSSVLRNEGEILDVKRLKELYQNEKKITILINEQEKDINLSYISALSAELILHVSPEVAEKKPFLNNTDLLDFPGARSRLDLEVDSISRESAPDMLLRGKIAYLFNKYSTDFEVNNLLFCINDKQLDVNELPSLLNDWIKNNIGDTFKDRANTIKDLSISPLFIVMTFFNNQLKFDTVNDTEGDFKYKWDTRFHRFFENEIVTTSYDWHKNWLAKDNVFTNFYLLRDFKYSEDTFIGYEKENKETGVHPERNDFLADLKKSFVSHPFVKEHFKEPEESWDETTQLNVDGSKLIIKNLEPAANNYIKISNYVTQLKSFNELVINKLNKYCHSDNISDKRIKANNEANAIQLEFNRIFGQNPLYFSEFIKSKLLAESDAYNYFHDNIVTEQQNATFDQYTLLRSQFPKLSANNTSEGNIEILKRSMNFTNNSDVEAFLKERNINLDLLFVKKNITSAKDLVNGLFSFWEENYLNEEKFSKFTDLGLSKSILDVYITALKTTIDNQNLKARISSAIEDLTEGFQIRREHEEFFASVSSQYLNDFISNFGFNFYNDEKLKELETISSDFELNYETLISSNNSYVNEIVIKNIFDNISNNDVNAIDDGLNAMIANYNKWLSKIKIALISNCGFVNYNVVENHELKELIAELEKLNFSIE
jgi:hypothetical protein